MILLINNQEISNDYGIVCNNYTDVVINFHY